MTLREAIDRTDRLTQNDFSEEVKRRWIEQLDGRIARELPHRPPTDLPAYDDATCLLVPEPYAEPVYHSFLTAQFERENGETARYNQSAALFESAYQEFASWYNRTHPPLCAAQCFRV